MIDFTQLLKDDRALKALEDNKNGLANLSEIEEVLLVSTWFKLHRQMLVIVKGNSYAAQQLYYRLYPLVKSDVLLFTVEESLRVEAVAASNGIYADQMDALTQIITENSPKIVITHPSAVIRYFPKKDTFEKHILKLKVNDNYELLKIRDLLIASGYRQTARVDQPLTFSVRGGVIDVFSIQDKQPLRIEFFDNEIDSLRYFDIATQKTVTKINEATIMPASVLIYDEDFTEVEKNISRQLQLSKMKSDNPNQLEENILRDLSYLRNHLFEHYLYRYQCFFNQRAGFLSYFDKFKLIISTDEDVEANLSLVFEDNNAYIRELFENNMGLNYYSLFMDFNIETAKYHPYHIHTFATGKESFKSEIALSYFPLLPLDKAVKQIADLSKQNQIIVSLTDQQKMLLDEAFKQENLNSQDYLQYTDQQFFEGFNYRQYMVLTAKELFGVKQIKSRYESKFKEAVILDSYEDLKINDYVVHNQYGIGQYEGIITKEINGKHRDYLQIRYRDDDMLLVPLEQFKLVRKFVSSEGVGIKLSKLGTNSWNKTKEKIEKEVNDIAQKLVELYSAREENIGYAFSKDDNYSLKFEADFPFELTNDQKKVIAEVKKDMESPKPMDRLLCGDVGFGKTEVAMVAAFKAVKDLKQVAYLCPTTILSMQHFNTFVERFKSFSVKVKVLNRYILPSQQKQIIKELQEGKIDIIIGTHRLLSSDVKFADLGLLIIDEEQRFGVQAKEKIKELKNGIDVLSLSATPIPRTLQMSLVGVMNLSQLETAPRNRMPIQTYVVEKNDRLIKEVMERELARNGQVFYLHNNVSDIYLVARKISAMIPQAKIAVGHGKMSRDEIEDVMYRFVTGEYNVLICTTIIETGIDISNANTIIIEDADRFGLSQLYQIRGRVGRSDRVAYAYLLYRPNRQLSEVASKRLQAIKDFTELGSGYKIAMRDLAIRGAGDLLGEKQAGFINTIGMSLYLDILNKAIKEKQGQKEEEKPDNKIKIKELDGYIPQQFVPQDMEKLSIYQKLDAIDSYDQLMKYQETLNDFYGKLPTVINNLFVKKQLELLLNSVNVDDYLELEKEDRLILSQEFSDNVDGVKLFETISNISNEIKLTYRQKKIILTFPKRKNYLNQIVKVLQEIEKICD
ncbi:MAG: transcription-repair coupling factor [Erysipelotrichia bacterium]|nr:transcription-repair coupling factor [Erysipelotrichia bacterium]